LTAKAAANMFYEKSLETSNIMLGFPTPFAVLLDALLLLEHQVKHGNKY